MNRTDFEVLLRVNPLYYVTFTTATLCASFLLFQGFNTTDSVNTISLLAGFLVIFAGVYLLNLSRGDPDGQKLLANGHKSEGIPTDPIAGGFTRRSMQARRSSIEQYHRRRVSGGSIGASSIEGHGLMRDYDEEHAAGPAYELGDLTEDDEGEKMEMQSPIDSPVFANSRGMNGLSHANGPTPSKPPDL